MPRRRCQWAAPWYLPSSREPQAPYSVGGLLPGTASPGGPARSRDLAGGELLDACHPERRRCRARRLPPSSLLPFPGRPNESGKLRGHGGFLPSRKTSGPGPAVSIGGAPGAKEAHTTQISPSMGYKNGQYRGPPGRSRAEGVTRGQKVGKISPWYWPKFTTS